MTFFCVVLRVGRNVLYAVLLNPFSVAHFRNHFRYPSFFSMVEFLMPISSFFPESPLSPQKKALQISVAPFLIFVSQNVSQSHFLSKLGHSAGGASPLVLQTPEHRKLNLESHIIVQTPEHTNHHLEAYNSDWRSLGCETHQGPSSRLTVA